jgi:uncharacterized protein (DUF1697 family)
VTTYIALLRGINVGGHKQVAMADLRALAGKIGLANTQTLLQSGNMVFESDLRTSVAIEQLLEAEAKKRLGLDTEFHVRTVKEWKSAIACNPFSAEAKADPGHMLMSCFKVAPPGRAASA